MEVSISWHDSHQWRRHTLLSTQTLFNAETNSHLLYLIFSPWPIKSCTENLHWSNHGILSPNVPPHTHTHTKWQVESLQCWLEEEKLLEWDEPNSWKLYCSVSLKPSSRRERCSHQSAAGFSASDAFRLLDDKKKSQNKAWKWQFNRGLLLSELSHERRWRGAGWGGTLASHAQDHKPGSH